jgi:hypothetical protein
LRLPVRRYWYRASTGRVPVGYEPKQVSTLLPLPLFGRYNTAAKSGDRMRRLASIGIVLLALSHLVFANASSALAQAGSTGGTIGKTDKSVSGGGEAASPEPRAKSHATSRAAAGSRSEVRSGSPDGSWAVSASPNCLPSWTLAVSVSNGVISGGATGQVSRAGAVRGQAVVLGMKFDFVGHYRGGQASGTLVGPNGCPGQWTATKS